MTKLIALCGAPGSGKSAVQDILFNRFNIQPVDDGWPLRDFAIRHCGARLLDVETQAGKAAEFPFPGGRSIVMRKFLGELGNWIEAQLGPDAIPEMAIQAIKRSPTKGAAGYSFGSTRRKQGNVYKRHGGMVIEIVREGHSVINEFDRYDLEAIDTTIINNGTLQELEQAVIKTVFPLLAP